MDGVARLHSKAPNSWDSAQGREVHWSMEWDDHMSPRVGRREQNMGRVDMVVMSCHSTDTEVGATLNLTASVNCFGEKRKHSCLLSVSQKCQLWEGA